MVNYQTGVQNASAIKFGSALVEVGATIGGLVNIGVASDIEFEESFTPIILKPDNAPEIQVGVKEHYASVKFNMWELDLGNLNLLRGGIDTYTSIAGTPVSIVDEPHQLTGYTSPQLERLDHKSGNGMVSSVTVEDALGATAVLNTDYILAVDSGGYTCIARIPGSTVISDGETVNVSYTYTPSVSETLTSGGLNTINPRVVRLTNTNAAGKIFRVTVYAAKNQNGITLSFPADDSDDVVQPEIELRGTVDTTRDAGDQLFEIYNEQ